VTVAFMPAEAAAAMSAEQMLVTISRPKDELIITTNSIDVVREYTTQSYERESATEFLEKGHQNNKVAIDHTAPRIKVEQKVDLHPGARVSTPAQKALSKKLIDFCVRLVVKEAEKKRIARAIEQRHEAIERFIDQPDLPKYGIASCEYEFEKKLGSKKGNVGFLLANRTEDDWNWM
jgi:hypothetical protein